MSRSTREAAAAGPSHGNASAAVRLTARQIETLGMSPGDAMELARIEQAAKNQAVMGCPPSKPLDVLVREAMARVGALPPLALCPRCRRPTREPTEPICIECDAHRRRLDELRSLAHELDAAIPDRYRAARFGTTPRDAHDARAVALGRRHVNTRFLVFEGPTSAGKTHLAIAMMRAWMEQHLKLALFLPTIQIWDRNGKPRRAYVEAPLVVLDDAGEEPPEDVVVKSLLHQRYSRNLPTWVTTWLTFEPAETKSSFSGRYGGGVRRRFVDEATFIRLPV